MSRKESVDNAIWTDPDFARLSPFAKLLYLWSFTNLRCNMAGLYKVDQEQMRECKVPESEIPAVLHELSEREFLFFEDEVMWVRSRVSHLSRSPKVAVSIARDVAKIRKDHPLRARFLDRYASEAWLRETLSELYPDPIDTVCETPVTKPDSHRVSIPSTDPIDRVQGSGRGRGKRVEGGSGGDPGKVDLPNGFPDELRPHLTAAYRVLRDLARRKDAKDPSPVALANVVMARPHKPIVKAAHDCAAHWEGRKQLSDVVAAYRNWLERTDDLAAVERITPALKLAAAPPGDTTSFVDALNRRNQGGAA